MAVDDGGYMHPVVFHNIRMDADGYLAAAFHQSQKGAFRVGTTLGGRVVQKLQHGPDFGIVRAAFDG